MGKKQTLLIDMYGVLIRESKGYFIPYTYALKRIQRPPEKCIFVDNSVKNLNAAQAVGINTVLFNRDQEAYSGTIVNNFRELDHLLKN